MMTQANKQGHSVGQVSGFHQICCKRSSGTVAERAAVLAVGVTENVTSCLVGEDMQERVSAQPGYPSAVSISKSGMVI